MKTFLTIQKIKNKFKKEWVLLENPVTNKFLEVVGGTVIYHSPNRNEIDQKALRSQHRKSAILYLGKISKNSIAVLYEVSF